jgi:hypothetical protein
MEKYDILAIQKMAINRRTGRAYCPFYRGIWWYIAAAKQLYTSTKDGT